jgi:hypothetical protein
MITDHSAFETEFSDEQDNSTIWTSGNGAGADAGGDFLDIY